jgi:hypothetical protein
VAASDWWASSIPTELCQGDIIPNVPFYICRSPLKHLKAVTLKKEREVWEEVGKPSLYSKEQKYFILASNNAYPGLVLSHGCEIEKPYMKRLLLAPVMELRTVDEAMQSVILEQRSHSAMLIPDVPALGHCYADLRMITAVPSELLALDEVICSMTEGARARLQAQLMDFFLRMRPPIAE